MEEKRLAVKARYEKGKLVPLEEVPLEENKIYEVEVKQKQERIAGVRKRHLQRLVGIVSIGGDALADSEALYDGEATT